MIDFDKIMESRPEYDVGDYIQWDDSNKEEELQNGIMMPRVFVPNFRFLFD